MYFPISRGRLFDYCFALRFTPHAAGRLRPSADLFCGNPCKLELNDGASDFAIGAVMQPNISGSRQPIEFFSRRLPPMETRYSAIGPEELAA